MLNTAAVDALRSRIRAEIDDGHSLAAQFALGLNGEIVAAESFGTASEGRRRQFAEWTFAWRSGTPHLRRCRDLNALAIACVPP